MHRRFVAIVETLLEEEIAAGRMATPLPPHDLATVLVRVAESFTYADLIAGERPDADRAAAAAFALVLAPTRRSRDDRRRPRRSTDYRWTGRSRPAGTTTTCSGT